MPHELVRAPARRAKRGPNVRTDYGDEAKTRSLARSRAKCQVQPMVVRKDWTIIDGNRTHLGLELEGLLDVELDFIVTDEELTPDQIKSMQVNSAFHRSDLPDFDKATGIKDILAARPGMTKKQLAEEVLDTDPSQVTRYLAIFECVPDVQEAAKAGKLSISDWYAISKLKPEDQPSLLALKLTGASRDDLERHGRKKRAAQTPVVRAAKRIDVPLVSGAVVSVKADGVSMEEALEAVLEASKQLKAAIAKGITAKSAMGYWRDLAANA